MSIVGVHSKDRKLETLLTEASQALVQLDAARLEELAVSCTALVRESDSRTGQERVAVSRIQRELSAFGRTVEATGANLCVLRGLQDRHFVPPDYGPRALRPKVEVAHGDH